MASPTIDEAFNDLVAINKIVTVSLYELGKVRVKGMAEEDLRKLVLSTSRAILNHLPCRRLEHNAIKEMDSKYSDILTKLEAGPCTQ